MNKHTSMVNEYWNVDIFCILGLARVLRPEHSACLHVCIDACRDAACDGLEMRIFSSQDGIHWSRVRLCAWVWCSMSLVSRCCAKGHTCSRALHMSVHTSIHRSTHMSAYMSVHKSVRVYMNVCKHACSHMSAGLSIHTYIAIYTCLYTGPVKLPHMSVHASVHMSTQVSSHAPHTHVYTHVHTGCDAITIVLRRWLPCPVR